MSDPFSAIASGFFIEDIESLTIATAPASKCKLTVWKHYVDDILEKKIQGGEDTGVHTPSQHHWLHGKH